MSPVNLTSALVVGALYTAGTYMLLQRSLMRVLIGLVLLGHGTTLLLLLVGGESGLPPMVGSTGPEAMSDPLPQAMALTSIVITFALTTFLLALAYRAWTLLGDDEVRDDIEDARIARTDQRADRRLDRRGGRREDPSHPRGQRPAGPAGPAGNAEPAGGPAEPRTEAIRREPGELAVPGLLERQDVGGWRP
ncbi:multisubunit sodium/proton antiporter, MrpC subunit [Frankia sp. EI5c]|uniref:Na(+)/H(+) antiporter subunit C n=1 Tax=Frankia sp. EI5c TaxID=683316 RepID=UPI0007C28E23|nr:Na(+)/H(+) antiporter subunit C [Frankia sp. EI5c]OAA28763.1 multisubunit sodium/proton antiporter, MrpC subunit [Frankia sp. EI5c]